MRQIHAPLALAATLALSAWGCSQAQQQGQTAKSQSDNSGTNTDGSSSGNDGSNGNSNSNGSSNGNGGTSAASGASFDAWCAAAGQTQVSQQVLADYFGKLCSNGKATGLWGTLVNLAYSGSGTPQVKYLQPISSDNNANTTTAYFGVGIKLPISIQSHFDNIGPKAGSKAEQQKLTEAQGAQQTSLDIQPRQSNDKDWVRGWTVHSVAAQNEGIVNLTVDNVVLSDQYMLQKGQLYMYTSSTDQSQPTQTIKDYSLMTAGVQINGSGYLITVAHLVADDHGLHQLAQDKIKTTALGVIKAMYNVAAPGGGSSGLVDEPAASE